ncbi:polyphosphate polymerase domain-containing protein [Microbacterium sp.]|uniref:polyphosphate polymerase domain-containing protein n=1 Tax=Microbacterium sp. TaxID=51671 RepID=UPI003F702C3A
MTGLARFAPVGLDELVAEASLLTRVDRKYVVPRPVIDRLLGELDAGSRVLEIDGARDFAYESVYFDTPDLLSFRMAAQPRRRRFKLRTRTYLDIGTAYLEIKTRGARGATVKERSAYAAEHRAMLTITARDDAAAAFDAIGVDAGRADDLDATLVTRYRRATLLSAHGRATVDTDLAWVEPGGAGFTLPHLAIIETKSEGAASAVDRLLWRAGCRPATVSKYATGLAALHPELPRNRWARLLRGTFSPAAVHDHDTPTHPTRTSRSLTKEPSCDVAA